LEKREEWATKKDQTNHNQPPNGAAAMCVQKLCHMNEINESTHLPLATPKSSLNPAEFTSPT